MTSSPAGAADPLRFRRVLVAFDSGDEPAAAIEMTAALAARLQADLLALFVEDIDLLRLSEHPQVQAFSMLSGSGRSLATDHLKRVLRLRLARNREAMAEAAARLRVNCALQICKGRLLSEVLNAAAVDDLVVIGWTRGDNRPSWSSSRLPPHAIADALAEARVRSVLLLHPETPVLGPVLVAFDGSAVGWTALTAAAQVADQDGGVIEVALLSGRLDEAEGWRAEIASLLAGSRLKVRFLHLPKARLEDLCLAADREGATLLVVGAERARAVDETGRRALERLACSVLIVHRSPSEESPRP
jgi:nucleotide-binding universal stress UspA family protein